LLEVAQQLMASRDGVVDDLESGMYRICSGANESATSKA
jgi:hypothetical protein